MLSLERHSWPIMNFPTVGGGASVGFFFKKNSLSDYTSFKFSPFFFSCSLWRFLSSNFFYINSTLIGFPMFVLVRGHSVAGNQRKLYFAISIAGLRCPCGTVSRQEFAVFFSSLSPETHASKQLFFI